MNVHRRQRIGWTILIAFVLACTTWLWRAELSRRITTNVLELLPVAESDPELGLVRAMANEAEARTMLLSVHTTGTADAAAAAAAVAAELGRDPAFSQAVAMGDEAPRDALGREVFARRLTLLFPGWLAERRTAYAGLRRPAKPFAEWLADDAAAALSRFLAQPAALAFQDLLPADPLLLAPGVVARLKPGLGWGETTGKAPGALVWAQLSHSPLSEEGQAPAFGAIERVRERLRDRFAGLSIRYTGINRFAAASRARIEQEVSRLNLLSVLAVFAIALIFVRGVHRALHLVPVVLLSVLGGWTLVTLVFDQVHVLVFVVGSLLTGVAIDYGFYLYMQPPAFPGEEYWPKVRRLAKPLLASSFTTVAGFALLLFSDLPLIRQLGVFVGAGLLSALGAALIYFSTVRNPFLPARSFRGGGALPPPWRSGLRRGVIVLWVAALAGLGRLHWRDDVRELEIPSPQLKRLDAGIRREFGERPDRTVYLTYGATLAVARNRLEALDGWLEQQGAVPASLAAVIPTEAAHEEAVAFARTAIGFPTELRRVLAARGFDADAFHPFFEAYAEFAQHETPTRLEESVIALTTRLAGPMGLLVHAEGPVKWYVTLVDRRVASTPPPELHSLARNQLETLNAVFGRYRRSATILSAVGLAIVGIGVLLTYGLRDGLRIFAIPCGACLGVFGVFGWVGQPLNLFHLLGAFLGVCLTHNYSIFTATSAYRHEPPPVSVRLSALTTAASFGVLASSGIPVVRALGLTVAAMVAASLLVIELEHLQSLSHRSNERQAIRT